MENTKLLKIIESISNLDDGNFYHDFCLALADAIDAPFVFIASIDSDKRIANTISLAANYCITDNITYSLKNTPCEKVSDGDFCCYLDDVQQTFPKDELLNELGVKGYVGISLKDSDNNVKAILSAMYHDEIPDKDEILSFFLLFKGLLEKQLANDTFIEKLRFLDAMIEQTHEAIFVCNEDNIIIDCNPALIALTGYEKSELIGKSPSIFRSGVHREAFYQEMWETIQAKNKWTGEITNVKKSGEHFTQHLTINIINHLGNKCYVAFMWDITEQKKAQEKIFYQANYDALTGLTNRFFFTEKLLDVLKSYTLTPESKIQTSIIYLDIDNFNHINNAYGLSFGDSVLIALANRLECFNEKYTLSRLDGDGFGVLIQYNCIAELFSEIERLNQLLQKPLNIDGITIVCCVSMGVSTYNFKDGGAISVNLLSSSKKMIRQAAQAMRHAKHSQDNNFLFFDKTMEKVFFRETRLKNELAHAIEQKILTVHYQPIINLKNNRVIKFECLVRWYNNESWVSPAEFIPIAEKFGLIIPLGKLVLESACDVVNELSIQGVDNIVFNVNRSIFEFTKLDSNNNDWLNTITKKKTPSHLIAFELTESALAPENEQYLTSLQQLQAAGCKISLDDFGTGYSSLSYLRKFPIDFLKIDKSFIHDIENNDSDKVLVNSIISMAHALGIAVVAEGVENQNQLAILKNFKCEFIQGFYFSKPLPKEQILSFIKKHNGMPLLQKRRSVALHY